MADRLEITCPCCRTELVVDAVSGEILSEVRPKPGTKSFEDALSELRSGSQKREELFSKAMDRTRRLEDLLEKKFEEAKKKTKDDPTRPIRDLDLD